MRTRVKPKASDAYEQMEKFTKLRTKVKKFETYGMKCYFIM